MPTTDLPGDLRAQGDGVELQADIAAERRSGHARRAFGLADVAVQVIEHETDVVVDVPVGADGDDLLLAAGDGIARCAGRGARRVIAVEVDDAVARAELERAPTALRQGRELERVIRADRAIGA